MRLPNLGTPADLEKMTLDQLRPGQTGRITTVTGGPALVQRLYELGLLEGTELELIGRAPLGDPLEIRCGSARLSLRKSDAAGISVCPLG